MPKIHGKGSLTLSSTLIHIPCSLIEVAQHGHQSIAVTIRTTHIGSTGADIGNGNTNTTSLCGSKLLHKKIGPKQNCDVLVLANGSKSSLHIDPKMFLKSAKELILKSVHIASGYHRYLQCYLLSSSIESRKTSAVSVYPN